MEQFFTDYESFFVEAQNEVHRILDALPEEALNWKPGPDMNSTAVLITHIAGAARFSLGDVASGDESGRVRQQEFELEQVTTALLRSRLDNCVAYIQSAVKKMTLGDLSTMRSAPNRKESFSVGWCLLHALEHTTEHVGQLQIILQLWQSQTRNS